VYTDAKGWNLDVKNTEERHVPGNYAGKWDKQNVLCDLNASFLRGRPGKLDGWYFGVGVAGAKAAFGSNELAKVTGMSALRAPIETASPAPSLAAASSTSSISPATPAPSLAAASSTSSISPATPAPAKKRRSSPAATTPTPKRRRRRH
jgi:hypothetical protein